MSGQLAIEDRLVLPERGPLGSSDAELLRELVGYLKKDDVRLEQSMGYGSTRAWAIGQRGTGTLRQRVEASVEELRRRL